MQGKQRGVARDIDAPGRRVEDVRRARGVERDPAKIAGADERAPAVEDTAGLCFIPGDDTIQLQTVRLSLERTASTSRGRYDGLRLPP